MKNDPDTPPRCRAEIDLGALERNVNALRGLLPAGARYGAVVKADAYGHGLVPVVERLAARGVDFFGVANVTEAAAVRRIDPERPILLLSAVLPEEDDCLAPYDLTATVSTGEEVVRFDEAGRRAGRRLPVHLKIDTGMGRLGVWHEEAPALYASLVAARHLELRGVYTHLSSADCDPNFTERQRLLFLDTLDKMPGLERERLMIHADNSAGFDTFDPERGFNAVRIGLAQYGVIPGEHAKHLLRRVELQPVCSLHARVTVVKTLPAGAPVSYGQTHRLERETRVAVVSAGYGDGIHRACGNRGSVLVRGCRCPILGRVTMDEIVVDVTGAGAAACGDEATFFGARDGAAITVREFSGWCGTIPWEVLCAISRRVPRRYRG